MKFFEETKYFIKIICFFQYYFVWNNKKPGSRTDPGKRKVMKCLPD